VRIRQYAYFIVKSEVLTPAEITALLLLEPDEIRPMGSRHKGPPPVPRAHVWTLRSGVSDQSGLEAHFDALLPRLHPAAAAIMAAAAAGQITATLSVVRRFSDGAEDFDESTYGIEPGSAFERLSGQHPFLGWGLDSEAIAFLGTSKIGLDVDEYG
jgi:hypothetical protein